jgi:hypothetical protein
VTDTASLRAGGVFSFVRTHGRVDGFAVHAGSVGGNRAVHDIHSGTDRRVDGEPVHPTVLTNRDSSCKFTTFVILMSIFLLIVSVTRHFLLAHAWVIPAARVQLLFI